jgi:hypothetical protein
MGLITTSRSDILLCLTSMRTSSGRDVNPISFLEALSVACYEKKKDLSELFSDTFTYEEMLHSMYFLMKIIFHGCFGKKQAWVTKNMY